MRKYTLSEARAILTRITKNQHQQRRTILVWDKGFGVGVLKEIPMLYDQARQETHATPLDAAYKVVCLMYYKEGVTDPQAALDRMLAEPVSEMLSEINCYEMAPPGVSDRLLVMARERLEETLRAKIAEPS